LINIMKVREKENFFDQEEIQIFKRKQSKIQSNIQTTIQFISI